MPQNYGKNKDGRTEHLAAALSSCGSRNRRTTLATARSQAEAEYKATSPVSKERVEPTRTISRHPGRTGPVGFVDAGRKGVNEEEKWETARADKKGGFLVASSIKRRSLTWIAELLGFGALLSSVTS